MKSRWLSVTTTCLSLACSATHGPVAPQPAPPTTEAEWLDRTSPLRPTSAAEALDAATKDPKDPTSYALLADSYAGSDAPVMALAYGLYYRAMGTDCASDRTAAMAMARVIAQKLTIVESPAGTFVATSRLVRLEVEPKQLEGGKQAEALALSLARSLEKSLPGYRENTIGDFQALLSRWIDSEMPMGSVEELREWLRKTREAGHLAALVQLALGPAYPDEFKKYQKEHDAELRAAESYFDTHLFVPSKVPRADEPVTPR